MLQPRQENSEPTRVPLSSLLRYRSAWGLAFGQMGYLYAYHVFVNWLPAYLILERDMSVVRTGIVASLPFLVGMIATIGGGWLGDYVIRRGLSPTFARKSIVGTGMMIATVLVVTAAYTPQTWLAVTLLTLCMGFLRATTGSANAMAMDLAPRAAVGSLTSIQNFGGNVGGLMAPIVTGLYFGSNGLFHWCPGGGRRSDDVWRPSPTCLLWDLWREWRFNKRARGLNGLARSPRL